MTAVTFYPKVYVDIGGNRGHGYYASIKVTEGMNGYGLEDGFATTSSVGSFPSGASPYGVMDMAGNVWELISSLYDDDTLTRVVRGGHWGFVTFLGYTARSFTSFGDDGRSEALDFRCAKSGSTGTAR